MELMITSLLERLYIMLALISFFFFFFNLAEQLLKIHWTDFRKMKKFYGCRWLIWTSFSHILRDVAMATNFVNKNGKLPAFVSLAIWNRMGYCYLNVCINGIYITSRANNIQGAPIKNNPLDKIHHFSCCNRFLPREAMLSTVFAVVVCVCVCVCLSHSGIVSKRLNVGSRNNAAW